MKLFRFVGRSLVARKRTTGTAKGTESGSYKGFAKRWWNTASLDAIQRRSESCAREERVSSGTIRKPDFKQKEKVRGGRYDFAFFFLVANIKWLIISIVDENNYLEAINCLRTVEGKREEKERTKERKKNIENN